jgi:hypothetical protein
MAELRNEFTWSNRRLRSFEECRRRYWFESYGHWGGWEEGASERTRAIWTLKKIKHRQMWVGELVHETIAGTLEQIRAGMATPVEPAVSRMLERMRAQFRQSKSGEYRRRPGSACGLYEHEYGVEVSDDEWTRCAEHAKRCVRHFFRCPFVDQMRQIPRSHWLEIEQLESFELDATRVWVKMDVAYRSLNGRVVIVDWKTGRLDPDPDPIQLTCYAAYAMGKWNAPADQIDTIEYNLSENEYVFRPVTPALVEQVRGRIAASIEEMKKLLVGAAAENVPLPESSFPVSADARVCDRCVFLKVCPDSPAARIASPRPGELF